MSTKTEICTLLDKELLMLFDLIEQQVQCKLNIENVTIDGQLMIAKSRYINGTQTVSVAQLPTENSNEFNALATVSCDPENSSTTNRFEINRHPIDKNSGHVEPLKWFGILTPQSLLTAQQRFQNAIEYVCECANIQVNVMQTLFNILKLKEMKINV